MKYTLQLQYHSQAIQYVKKIWFAIICLVLVVRCRGNRTRMTIFLDPCSRHTFKKGRCNPPHKGRGGANCWFNTWAARRHRLCASLALAVVVFCNEEQSFRCYFSRFTLFCLCFFCSTPVSATIPNCSFHASSSICSSYKESFLCSAIVSRLLGCHISNILHLFHN